jgi:hypothetical protein
LNFSPQFFFFQTEVRALDHRTHSHRTTTHHTPQKHQRERVKSTLAHHTQKQKNVFIYATDTIFKRETPKNDKKKWRALSGALQIHEMTRRVSRFASAKERVCVFNVRERERERERARVLAKERAIQKLVSFATLSWIVEASPRGCVVCFIRQHTSAYVSIRQQTSGTCLQ